MEIKNNDSDSEFAAKYITQNTIRVEAHHLRGDLVITVNGEHSGTARPIYCEVSKQVIGYTLYGMNFSNAGAIVEYVHCCAVKNISSWR